MTAAAALTSCKCTNTFQFSAGMRTVRVSVMSTSFPVADCSTLTDQRLKSFVDQRQLFWSEAQPGHLDLAKCRDCRNRSHHRHEVLSGERLTAYA